MVTRHTLTTGVGRIAAPGPHLQPVVVWRYLRLLGKSLARAGVRECALHGGGNLLD